MKTPQIPEAVSKILEEASISLCISDARGQDMPLVQVNEPFVSLTGYSYEEVIGHNCRFLQGQVRQEKVAVNVGRKLEQHGEIQTVIRNQRKSGATFDNFLFIFPLLGGDDRPVHFLGSQFEIPDENQSFAFMEHVKELQKVINNLNAVRKERRERLIEQKLLIQTSASTLVKVRLASFV
ncbi:PAS domain-containing protein [Algicella marina]|uniref:PAS domain-containing protein n=1 Tax=Algicella marina TaxID=2683284 RepID=UPI00137B044E|nr:PAS domain-containing protein [Algicella marina]